MATITGYTAEKMDEIVDSIVETAIVNGVGHLILTKHGGTTVDAGPVIGPPGPAGTDAVALRSIGELSIAVWELEAKVLAQDNAMVDWLGDPFVPGINHIASRTLDGSGYAILGLWRNVDRDVGFMGIDDFNPFAQYLDGLEVVKSGGISATNGLVLSPDKKWAAGGSGTGIRIWPVTADGFIDNTVAPALTTLAGGVSFASGNAGRTSIKFTPDGKALICLINGTPFIHAYAFNTVTGVVGAKAADPAVLMAQVAFGGFDISANSGYVAIAGGETATPFFTVYAYNSTTNVWGAKSAAPATAPGGVTGSIAFDDASANLIITTASGPLLRSYGFNQATGVIGASADAAGTLTNLQYMVQRAGKVIAVCGTTPFVRGYNLTAGAWSAQWAAPASLPTALPNFFGISDSGALFYYSDSSVANTPQAYVLNANTFGSKVTPTNMDSSFSFSGAQGIPWPIRNRDDVAFPTGAAAIGVGLFGDPSGTTALTGQAQSITKTLAAACQSVFIIDSFSKSSANVTRQYDISLDGGATWNNNVPVNTVVLLPTPGTQLKVRITMTRTALGQTGQIFWFNVWAG